MDRCPMVHLTSVHDSFHARVIAARLGSDGILTELRGDLNSLYPAAGEVRVFVGREDLAVARELLLADEVEWCFDEPDDPDGGPTRPRAPTSVFRWIAVAAAVLLVAMWVTRGI
ncbi:MAG: hypothetical protein ABIW46_01025 [Acidimicrobiales bacterium]